ncbi:PTS-dependent dihydroxyacetone kinase phosphotransferase subunit DhaM [Amphibacillus sp. MSJ-3]|uniref:dihydroxyacetone kinase phosphoryl donor subunit DhaM n=1 Tax=Amphibacillus sp. MSJ-3 TaxID=2841505 RepID=UPI001C0F2558|nr:dihydroxyacetone kinase phosphoryl donor subunit DhaM [Amphibacillus sp. MSJ-3]MBU5594518.1 PTS-dependent dihydroxyacetone kinase phosphotransferase subunit DhaM [Amphibacillus sp. MSJ-3]
MTKKQSIGIIITSHVEELARGVYLLLKESAPDVSITYAGGTDDGDIGSSFDKIQAAVEENDCDELFAFYDLGSAKMTLEVVQDTSEKKIHLMDTALIEGSYTTAALLQGNYKLADIKNQLTPLVIK